jgi:hypothetical protein
MLNAPRVAVREWCILRKKKHFSVSCNGDGNITDKHCFIRFGGFDLADFSAILWLLLLLGQSLWLHGPSLATW